MKRNLINLMKSAIALADTLNFSRAAKVLHVSQPTLTKNVAALEDWVGVPLFERDRQNVTINDAGRVFVEEARVSVLHCDRAVQAARAATHSSEAVLNIGRSPYTDPFLISILLSVRLPLFPKLRVELSSQFSCDLIHDVLAGSMDLVIATEPPLSPMLSATKIAESPFYIAMSDDHELATREALSLTDLDGKEWVLFEHRIHPRLHDSVMRQAHVNHVIPAQIHHVMTAEEAFSFVSEGHCVAFLNKSGALRLANGQITMRPLAEDSLLLRTYIAARADNKSKVASEFVRTFVRKISQFSVIRQLPLTIPA
jgi:DNA-binding transcriptional LysR family regulator